MIPSQIRIVESLPRLSSGKLDRQSLSVAPSDAERPEKTPVRPRDAVEQDLVEIWEELLQIQPIGVTDDFFDLGGHSLLAVRLAARIEERFGRSMPLAELLLGSTIEELAVRLRGPVSATENPLLVDLGAMGPGPPIVLVHPIGGGVLCYNDLARRLDGKHPVYALQSVGLERDEEPEHDLARMAAQYVDVLRHKQPVGPYFLAGWSMGGVVAFEMARQLVADGHDVSRLFLIDCSVPRPRRNISPVDESVVLAAFAADLAQTAGPKVARRSRTRSGPRPREDRWRSRSIGPFA